MKFEIKNRWNGKIVYSDEAESFRVFAESAVQSGADLSMADLSGVDLSRAYLSRARLSGADLSRANLPGADLSRADLSGADLSRANLSMADLSKADLSETDLSGADPSGAGLYGYFSFGPGGSRNAYTWARWEQGGYMVHCGCKALALKDFAAAVKKTHGKNYHGKFYIANIAVMELVARESEKEFREYESGIAAKAA